MKIPNFVIVSLSRCGSTTLFRTIELHHDIKIAYEPNYGESWKDISGFEANLQALKMQFDGVKHVWDPNGWPFVNREHISTLNSLSGYEYWLSINMKLVASKVWDKVIFLRRKNQLSRVVSDLLGQQTGLWGHSPKKPYHRKEKFQYHSALKSRRLNPLNLEVIEWYMDHTAELENSLIASVPAQAKIVVCYEELFGPDQSLDARLGAMARVFDVLGLPLPVADDRFRLLVSPESKYNDESTLEKIPNIKEIRSHFGQV